MDRKLGERASLTWNDAYRMDSRYLLKNGTGEAARIQYVSSI